MKVLVVDGDRVMADVVAYALQHEGFEVFQAHDGLSALERWAEVHPDLLILDVNLPRLDGFAVCQRIRRESDTPIIFLSVRCDDANVVQGLELGADAYLGKPFSPRQLVARANAVLRRAFPGTPVGWDRAVQQPGTRAYSLDHGKTIHLTPLEGRLFELLRSSPGEVQSFEAIMEHVWGSSRGYSRDMLRQLVHRLRNKIEADPANPSHIMTIPGRGYALANAPEAQRL